MSYKFIFFIHLLHQCNASSVYEIKLNERFKIVILSYPIIHDDSQ
jgi:hypothetical protein